MISTKGKSEAVSGIDSDKKETWKYLPNWYFLFLL